MSEREQQESLYRDVQRALWTEWDPIGVNSVDYPAASDEYDGYAAAVVRALQSGGGEHGLAKVLRDFERLAMGIDRPYAESLAAATRIRAVLNWSDRDAAR